jgi:Protein of unknown function (DUF1569)
MNKLDELINQLEAQVKNLNKANLDISKANVGWHIEHTLLTLNGITSTFAKSNPADYKWTFNFVKMIVFTTKKIPRGRAKSPELVVPKGENTVENLERHISKTREKMKELKTMSDDKFFKHPYFGNLKKQQTLKFLEIHTKHHLDIILDIVK